MSNFKLSPIAAYICSVAVDKGFSIITIPLLAVYLTPAEYGRLDVAVSLVEVIGLVMSFGIAEVLIRYASMAEDDAQRKQAAGELLAAGLLISVVLGSIFQLIVPYLVASLKIGVSELALRVALLGATPTAAIELPLMWQRMRGRASLFLAVIAVRSTIQVGSMWAGLHAGFGADGILISNGCVMVGLAAVMAGWQIAETGLVWPRQALGRIWRYGVPLVLGAMALFALGSLNRLFLSGRVPEAEIAFLALATKLSLAAPLLFQPFMMWWSPRRLAVLATPGGLVESARFWGIGFSVLLVSALGVCLAGPVFIAVFLPAGYAGAAAYLPFVVLVCVLNEVNSLSNAGAYSRDNGLAVLGANSAGALAAIIGYALLTPSLGVPGALGAMIAGQIVRLAAFMVLGHRYAPVCYPAGSAAAVLAAVALAVWFAPPAAAIVARVAWSVVCVSAVVALIVALRLVALPPHWQPAALWKRANVAFR